MLFGAPRAEDQLRVVEWYRRQLQTRPSGIWAGIPAATHTFELRVVEQEGGGVLALVHRRQGRARLLVRCLGVNDVYENEYGSAWKVQIVPCSFGYASFKRWTASCLTRILNWSRPGRHDNQEPH